VWFGGGEGVGVGGLLQDLGGVASEGVGAGVVDAVLNRPGSGGGADPTKG
jgi:hypothetical protein